MNKFSLRDRKVAKEVGIIAGNARKQIEGKSGKKVITKENYLSLKQQQKLKSG